MSWECSAAVEKTGGRDGAGPGVRTLVARQARRAGDLAAAGRERARRPERRPGAAGRSRDRQDGAVALPDQSGHGVHGGPCGRGRIGDGAGLRRPAPAVRADTRPARFAGRTAAARAERRVRAGRGRQPGPVPGRAGRAQPDGGDVGETAAAVRGGRRAMARPGLRSGPRLRRAPPAGRVGRAGVRGAPARRRTGRAAGARSRRAAGRSRAGAAGHGRPGAARRKRVRPDHRGDSRQSARPARALPAPRPGRTGRRVRAPGHRRSAQADRRPVHRAPRRVPARDAADDPAGRRRPGRGHGARSSGPPGSSA